MAEIARPCSVAGVGGAGRRVSVGGEYDKHTEVHRRCDSESGMDRGGGWPVTAPCRKQQPYERAILRSHVAISLRYTEFSCNVEAGVGADFTH